MNMILNEISQKEKNNTPYESTYIANLKNETNKTEEKQSHRYREQTGGCQEGSTTTVLPMNTQDLSPLGWTGWISLQSKGL